MKRRTMQTLATGLIVLSGTSFAAGQTGDQDLPLAKIERHKGPTRVTTDSYTQLHVELSEPALPPDRKKNKKTFDLLLASLGGAKKSKEISVVVRVRLGNVALPEQTLLRYKLDQAKDDLSIYAPSGISFPLKRLEAGEKIIADIVFLDTTAATYDVGGVAGSVADMIPVTSVVNDLSSPAIGSVFDLTSKMLSGMGTHSTLYNFSEELSPYGVGSKKVTIRLVDRTGTFFGSVTLSLLATPSFIFPTQDAMTFDPRMSRNPGDTPSKLINKVAGIEQSFVAGLRLLPNYTSMLKSPSAKSVRDFCNDARESLVVKGGLTVTDSSYAMYGAMREADVGVPGGEREWFQQCFSPSEVTILATNNGVTLPPAPQVVASSIPAESLFAFGCWMMSASGPDCAANAPNPRSKLESALSEKVRLNVDSSFGANGAFFERAPIARGDVISALKGVASSFSCFRQGMLVRSKTEKLFQFEGEYVDGQIAALNIYPVSETKSACR
jgi:hypothetical protein